MARRPENRNRPPLDAEALNALALHYLGRYATTRAKLRLYLKRKLIERGWAGGGTPETDALIERMAALGYVDDRAFATQRSSALARRGYGARRQAEALRAAGVETDDAAAVRAALTQEADDAGGDRAWDAALAYARRKRIGPFAAAAAADPDLRRRQTAAMLRAGHDFATVRRVLDAAGDGENR